ncbi:hypothetical protein AKJ09_10639 [Labilithrix luteola]|uniref:BNR repeat domain protein n=1 Tax=Labilithrix luteola TaxID=1391654 RepID=A0A0K1QDX8_9BACT|nr:RCC1 domain-containing protein [Labilithrix luteola]AKV03976.1 hypothetical protein AKJ09_10639 [Labilithrix luteola]
MKVRVQTILFGIVTSSTAAIPMVLGMAACAGDDERPTTYAEDATSEGTDVVSDAGPAPEASSDAKPAVDARAPFDGAAEPVTCTAGTASPCAVELVAGDHHFCARLSDATVRCWGADMFGQLGRGESGGPSPDAGAMPAVVGLTNVAQLSAAGDVTCALLDDGSIACWGANLAGTLGLAVDPAVADFDPHPTPAQVELGGATASRVDVGHGNVCALLTTGALVCWGDTQSRKLVRTGVDEGIIVGPGPAELDASGYTRTFGSSNTMFALGKSGGVFVWGAVAGDLGFLSGRLSSRSPESVPKPIDELSNVTSFAASPILFRQRTVPNHPRPVEVPYAHACAIANGEVFCWGRTFGGALCTGMPDNEALAKRAPIDSIEWPQQIAVGDDTTCVRMSDGQVQCCGDNVNGSLGTPNVGASSAFFAPATEVHEHVVHLAASQSSYCALVQGGTVECWGSNAWGELGSGPDYVAHATPTKITF